MLTPHFALRELESALAALDETATAGDWLAALVSQGLDKLPQPGGGDTLGRWRALAQVAARDLSLAKLYEGHTDALAILAQTGCARIAQAGSTWGTWAAEPPNAKVNIAAPIDGQISISGIKQWCSGASVLSHGLLTAWHKDGAGPQLVCVDMSAPGISIESQAWQAVGMAASASVDIHFDRTPAQLVGGPGDYLSRPGFWHGGAGIAACWYGAAAWLGQELRSAVSRATSGAASGFKLAALGKVDVSLEATAALLRQAAREIDDAQTVDAGSRPSPMAVAMRARLAAEQSAALVLDEVGRSLGAAPFCRNARFARMAADLPVFVRQSHAERDYAALAEQLIEDGLPWQL